MSNEFIEYKVIDKIGILSTFQSGWTKEINIVSWNSSVPKFDVRDWSPDHERMTRGITLYEPEARALAEALCEYFRSKEEKFAV